MEATGHLCYWSAGSGVYYRVRCHTPNGPPVTGRWGRWGKAEELQKDQAVKRCFLYAEARNKTGMLIGTGSWSWFGVQPHRKDHRFQRVIFFKQVENWKSLGTLHSMMESCAVQVTRWVAVWPKKDESPPRRVHLTRATAAVLQSLSRATFYSDKSRYRHLLFLFTAVVCCLICPFVQTGNWCILSVSAHSALLKQNTYISKLNVDFTLHTLDSSTVTPCADTKLSIGYVCSMPLRSRDI